MRSKCTQKRIERNCVCAVAAAAAAAAAIARLLSPFFVFFLPFHSSVCSILSGWDRSPQRWLNFFVVTFAAQLAMLAPYMLFAKCQYVTCIFRRAACMECRFGTYSASDRELLLLDCTKIRWVLVAFFSFPFIYSLVCHFTINTICFSSIQTQNYSGKLCIN